MNTRHRARQCRTGLASLLATALLVACGGGSTDASSPAPVAPTYTVGGAVTGLAGTGLVLQDNVGDDKPVSVNGSFGFATALAVGTPYVVSVKNQPTAPAQTCAVAHGNGTIVGSAVGDVTITCVNAAAYTIGGSVNGLAGSGLVLQDNLGDDTGVVASGAFGFATKLASGAAYLVTVKTQPTVPAQNCTVAGGSGTVGVASVGDVVVTCVAADADTRALSLAFAPAANAAMGVLFPYTVTERQGIALTGLTWYFDGVAGGHALAGLGNGTLQVWNAPGTHTVRVVATASNGRSAEASATIAAVSAPLASGEFHTCAMTPDGRVKCWGFGSNGELGNGGTSAQVTPVEVTGLTGVVGLAAGEGHSCAIKLDKTVACWGDNNGGELGNVASDTGQSAVPVAADGLVNVVALAAGRYHTCALKADGSVQCFGVNTEGELGSAASGTKSVVPVTVAGLSGVVAISAGRGYFTCALKADTTVACWGDNENGQLGSGTTSATPVPAPQTVLTAQGTALNRVLALRSGKNHTCAIVDDGSYSSYCWGDNSYHQIGASASGAYKATPVSGLSTTLMLASTDYTGCAFTLPSSFKCWGSNSYAEADANGAVGQNVTTPTAVTGLQSTATLPEYASGGNEFMCALQSDGGAKCVGRGGTGQLGNGLSTDAYSMQAVSAAAGTFWTWLGIVQR